MVINFSLLFMILFLLSFILFGYQLYQNMGGSSQNTNKSSTRTGLFLFGLFLLILVPYLPLYFDSKILLFVAILSFIITITWCGSTIICIGATLLTMPVLYIFCLIIFAFLFINQALIWGLDKTTTSVS